MYNKLKTVVLLALVTLATTTQAQFSTTSEKAIQKLENAKLFFDQRQHNKALAELNQAIAIDANFVEAHLMQASVFDDLKEPENAVQKYKDALAIKPDFFPNAWYALAKDEMLLMRFDDAKLDLEKFLAYPKISAGLQKEATKQLANCTFAIHAIANPVPFNPINLGPTVNSKYKDYFPSVSADEQTLFFTRALPIDSTNPKTRTQEDFYVSARKNNNTWGKAINAGQPLNTTANDGAQALSPDGQTIFFTVCEEAGGSYPEGRKGNGRCDVFFSLRNGDSWSQPRNINEPVSSASWDAQPCVASDGRTIYFISNRKGGLGGMDIWMCYVRDDNSWSEPINLGNKINTSGNEMSVFIHPDNQTLYFSSDGHIGLGKHDLFVSKRDSSNEWATPENLGYPINTPNDEWRLVVNSFGDKAYYSSDRAGGYGDLDLYEFVLPITARPKPVSYFKGKIVDFYTKKPIGAKLELLDLNTGKVVVNAYSNVGNGEFLICLPPNKDYALNVSKDNYLFFSENFSLKNETSAKPLTADITLKPLKVGEKVILKNIFFETGKFDLKPESKVELDKLVNFLAKNATVKIEISGHTDNAGDKKANVLLSDNRARVVYEYLIEKKINAERLSYKGYGDTQPIDVNTTAAGKANNRRTEFVIKGL
ncbi:MAG: OmpA family protein [Bacteroidia bacterium]